MNNKKIHGFDYARAIFSVLVVLWHIKVFGTSPLFNRTTEGPYSPSTSDIVNFQLLLQAVPFFILLSSYLYIGKSSSLEYLYKRVIRIGILLTFWPVAYLAVTGGYAAIASNITKAFGVPVLGIVTALWTLYYFFVGLLLVALLSEIARRCSTALLCLWLVAGCFVIMAFQWQTVVHGAVWTSAYWNPLNFLPYPAAAGLIYRFGPLLNSRAKTVAAALVAMFFLATILEYGLLIDPNFHPGQGYNFPAYTRLSLLVFCSGTLILCSQVVRPAGRIIEFMSLNSLELYCIHPFFLFLTGGIAQPAWVKAILVIASSYVATILLRRFVLNSKLLS